MRTIGDVHPFPVVYSLRPDGSKNTYNNGKRDISIIQKGIRGTQSVFIDSSGYNINSKCILLKI